jgi:hypothetical protein
MTVENDAIDATPEDEKTIGELYEKEFEQELDAEGNPITPEEEPEAEVIEGEEEPEGEPEVEPEGDEPEGEAEETPSDELQPLDDDESEPEEDQKVPLKTMLARIAKEKAKRAAAEAEAERLRAGGVPPDGSIPPHSEPHPTQMGKAPSEDDFEDHSDYIAAKAAYVAEQTYLKKQADAQARQQAEAQRKAQEKLIGDYSSKVDAEVLANPEKYPDFEENETLVTSAGLHGMALHSLMTADRPAPIVKYLAKHPEEMGRIAQLTPLQQVEEIGHLKKRSMVKPSKKTKTKASKPVNAERGDSSPPKKTKFSSSMSERDYDKLKASKGEGATVGDLLD